MFLRDVFICHASTDKERYARPLERALGRRAISCWVDEGQLDAGDSLFGGINRGLASSRYVAALITPAFIGRPWPEREIAAAFGREMQEAAVVVVPILVVSPEEAFAAYPLLNDKIYLRWDDGLSTVADRIARRFNRRPDINWHCDHPTEYVGHVWIRINAVEESIGAAHRVVARWGPLIKEVRLPSLGEDPIVLVHHKMYADAVTLQVEVDPPAIVTFGQGAPPNDPVSINIDEGWTRTSGWNFPTW